MVAPTNVRFSESVSEALGRYVRMTGQTKSGVVNSAVEEWLRMQLHPRIRFVTIETGERRATLTDGPQVWTVAEAWLSHDPAERSPESLADTLGVPSGMIDAALDYWAEHRAEIDGIVERHRIAQDEALAAWERRRAIDAA
ncbi:MULTISPECIES: hypothetical protein [Microbacterium]|uniref:CopG family transcriptional regulator n=1 Tax=Microbacterium sufflavum TaxID=2851649 RepID=A0ABY4IGH0_9MICO|nr:MULTISPECIES: hypothetical protein [Microbacterium]UPL10378.1 hypothetical protein KV394_04320 [Microbacterium sufflavum]